MEQVVAGMLAFGYASILVGMYAVRRRTPEWIKPIGIILIPQLSLWTAFYGLTFFVDPLQYRDFYVAMSRFGHMLDITFFWVLLLLIWNARKEQ